MGKKDIAAKVYLRNNAVFADLINVALYSGEQQVFPEDLTEMDTNEVLMWEAKEREAVSGKRSGKNKHIPVTQRFRDGLKLLSYMSDGEQEYLILGIEPQSYPNYAMPVRTMLWDSLTYDRQIRNRGKQRREQRIRQSSAEFLSGFGKEDRLIPVTSIVLNLSEKQWDGPLSLYDMLATQDPGVLSWVNDYRLHLIDPYAMSLEELNLFRTDLGNVLKFIKCSGNPDRMDQIVRENPGFQHMSREAVEMINTYTNTKLEYEADEGRKVNMCKAIDELKKRERREGRREGRRENCLENARALLDVLDAETIARKLKLPLETVLGLK